MSERLITPPGVVSFPHLFTPRAPSAGVDPRYSLVLVFTPEDQNAPAMPGGLDFTGMKRAFADCARAKWGDNMPRGLKSPARDCQEKDHFANFPAGSVFVNFWSKEQPAIINGAMQPITRASDVFAGQRARVSFRPFVYDNSGNRGVSVYLNNVQLVSMNEARLDGRAPPDREFAAVDDAGAADTGDAGSPGDDDNPFA